MKFLKQLKRGDVCIAASFCSILPESQRALVELQFMKFLALKLFDI